MRNGRILLAGLALALAAVPGTSRAQWKTPWSYDGARGPDHWGDLDPDYAACKTGKAQSPIDIESSRKAALPVLRLAYKSGPLVIVNNGYTAVRADYPRGNGNFLIVGGKRYELTQFHFHRPGEEAIHGRHADMVLHLMHRADDGKIAGVAVLLKAGRPNATVARLWDHMPQKAGKPMAVPGVAVDPGGLMPAATGYYTYEGSVSAPPCNEGVTWFVLKMPVEVSANQIARFARLYPHDARPVQPRNGRIVRESE